MKQKGKRIKGAEERAKDRRKRKERSGGGKNVDEVNGEIRQQTRESHKRSVFNPRTGFWRACTLARTDCVTVRPC